MGKQTTAKRIEDQVYMLLRRANSSAHKSQWHKEHGDASVILVNEASAHYLGQAYGFANSAEEIAHEFKINVIRVMNEVLDNAECKHIQYSGGLWRINEDQSK